MSHFETPSDLVQIPIVWRYELLKYFRSWRLIASVGISAVVLALIFFLPPALSTPYSGSDADKPLEVLSVGDTGGAVPYEYYAAINRTGVEVANMVVHLNGTVYPEDSWELVYIGTQQGASFIPAGVYAVVFSENVTGYEFTASYDWRISAQDYGSLNLNFASILIIICATFFAGDSIVGEYYNRTGYLIFPNPMKREVLFAGKFAASMTAGLIVVGLFYAGAAGFSMLAAGGIDGDMGASFLFAAEYLLAATAIGYLISAVMKGSTGAIVLTFLLLFLLLPIVDMISIFTGVKISASLTFAAGVLIYVLYDPYPVDVTQNVMGYEFSSFYPDVTVSVIVMLAYTVAAVAISLILFKRKQLSG
ncbi:MAG TPA: ABC transporter permease [Thermoplasmata archaeon]